MAETMIRVEGLGKCYQLQHQAVRSRYRTLQEDLRALPRRVLRRLRGVRENEENFWALRDVSFEVKGGDVLGIVGRNGAGKSTLLKILSRITEPTEGGAAVYGRIGSLLEVGTGFHPELTGRENIFLNGAILGMTRPEIRGKFDEIVAFAEVEKFLDTPVKRYSSGMYVRLAFAVAAHLDPEILIIDEVLAVGDAEFQKKCIGKMESAAQQEGRTILFVSHNMDAVLRLCNRAVLLRSGSVAAIGDAHTIVSQYASGGVEQPHDLLLSSAGLRPSPARNLRLVSAHWPIPRHAPWTTAFGEPIAFTVEVECMSRVTSAELGIALHAPAGFELASCSSIGAHPQVNLEPGPHRFGVTYENLKLTPGTYTFGIGLKSSSGVEDYIPRAFSVDVAPSISSSALRTDTFAGYLVPDVRYEIS